MKEVISMLSVGTFNNELSWIFYRHNFKPRPTQDFVKSEVNELFICISSSKLLI